MKVEKNNNSIFRNKHVLVVVAVMCIFTIIACMGFMLSVPAHAEENIAPKTEPIAYKILGVWPCCRMRRTCSGSDSVFT